MTKTGACRGCFRVEMSSSLTAIVSAPGTLSARHDGRGQRQTRTMLYGASSWRRKDWFVVPKLEGYSFVAEKTIRLRVTGS